MDSIEKVIGTHTDKLMSIAGVVGAGQGLYNDKPCIKIFVTKLTRAIRTKIPETLDGYPVIIKKTGIFRAL